MTLSRPNALRALVILVAAALLATLVATSADAAPRTKSKRQTTWAPAASASLTPGVMAYASTGQCTTNFVFTDATGGVYIGLAAHCVGKGGSTDTNGCKVDSLPLGSAITFNRGGSLLTNGSVIGSGTLAYSSWRTMRALGVTDAATCDYNDFALVKVAAKDVAKVNPSVPVWGGPTGIDTDGVRAGERVWSYGNSSLRAGVSLFSPKTGFTFADDAADRGWSHTFYTLTPGVPGDSGSAVLGAGGKAIGVLSTVLITPLPLANTVGDLGRELVFAQAHSGIAGLQLVKGTEPFRG
ncbi:serine protease [Nocardioides sp. R-C-SC26]|uniref:serine protease n=1 Tax=Nocardioides sp. R-C-SC26 TaxID=2870414 RepID=UPI001E3C6604|nr:serine protease [Nocardioides sp. R-C-SC26]